MRGTQAWQAAMANPAAWRQANDSGTQSSGNGNATSEHNIQAPYPSSPVVRAMRLDWSTHQRFAQGSDNFQLTWADDNHLKERDRLVLVGFNSISQVPVNLPEIKFACLALPAEMGTDPA